MDNRAQPAPVPTAREDVGAGADLDLDSPEQELVKNTVRSYTKLMRVASLQGNIEETERLLSHLNAFLQIRGLPGLPKKQTDQEPRMPSWSRHKKGDSTVFTKKSMCWEAAWCGGRGSTLRPPRLPEPS